MKKRECMSCKTPFSDKTPEGLGICLMCYDEFIAVGDETPVTLEELRGF